MIILEVGENTGVKDDQAVEKRRRERYQMIYDDFSNSSMIFPRAFIYNPKLHFAFTKMPSFVNYQNAIQENPAFSIPELPAILTLNQLMSTAWQKNINVNVT